MIDNNLRRSFEFFKSPVTAGQAALARPFSVQQVWGLHLLRAIILALLQYFLSPRVQFNPEAEGLTPEERILMESLQNAMDYYYSSPILIAVVNLVLGVLYTSFIWQVWRAISGEKAALPWHVAQSAFLRFLYVALGIYAVFAVFYALTGSSAIALIANMAMLYLFVLFLFVMKGALGLRSAWLSVLITFLAWMSMLGVFWVVSMIMRVLF